MRHRASRLTGMYRQRQALDTARETKKAEKKAERGRQGGGGEEKKTVEQVAAPK